MACIREPMVLYNVSPIKSPNLGRVNIVYLSSAEQPPSSHYAVVGGLPFVFCIDSSLAPNTICLNKAQREACIVSLGAQIDVLFICKEDISPIKLIRVQLQLVNLGKRSVDRVVLSEAFLKTYTGFPFSIGQIFYFVTDDLTLKATIDEIQSGPDDRLPPKNLSRIPHSGDQERTRDFNMNRRYKHSIQESEIPCTVVHEDNSDISTLGVMIPSTTVHFSSLTDQLSLLGSDGPLLTNTLDLSALGIGGLQKEFAVMFRRAFVQRCFDSKAVQRLGLPHVKGILLHGPPGTGKTLIARQIGKLLRANPPKVVSGPEVLSKYVGESEENVRALFSDAEADYKQNREKSSLHIIIFDELDAVFRARGTQHGVGDQVVNQLLAKMDGVEALDNILVIGMTNRPDIIDKALLRPGRFEIHVEISLPDEKGREEILRIHTSKMRKHGALNQNVDIQELARLSKNFTGAELQALVKSAASFALERAVQNRGDIQGNHELNVSKDRVLLDNMSLNRPDSVLQPVSGISSNNQGKRTPEIDSNNRTLNATSKILGEDSQYNIPNIIATDQTVCVMMDDFMRALDEVVPALGYAAKEFALYTKSFYNLPTFAQGLELITSSLQKLRTTTAYSTTSILLHGLPGTGKTTLAVRAAIMNKSPHIKMITPKDLVGLSENEKVNYIKERFTDAYRSSESLVILDEIETLIDFVSIGPRFSNAVLQAIKIFVKNMDKNKMFVIGTTSDLELTKECGIFDCFQFEYEVKPLNRDDLQLLKETDSDFEKLDMQLPAPIKTVLSAAPTKEA